MAAKFLFDRDVPLEPILDRTVAIVGYGAQGRSHALNLRDSGVPVVVGQRPGPGWDQAVADGFEPLSIGEAAVAADLVALMLPDERHREVYTSQVQSRLQPGDLLLTCHGFSLLYGLVEPPPDVACIMVAPKGAGHRVRSAYEEGGGVPCLYAAGPQANEDALTIARAYARAIGGGRGGILQTTLAEETETDLFGEQAVLCGGVSTLVKQAFDTLVAAGYQPEVAYFECVHELKLVVDLLHRGGLAYMREHISNTAEYGDYTRGPRVIGSEARRAMQEILDEIRSGAFAREWIAETESGWPKFQAMRQREKELPIQTVGEPITRLGENY